MLLHIMQFCHTVKPSRILTTAFDCKKAHRHREQHPHLVSNFLYGWSEPGMDMTLDLGKMNNGEVINRSATDGWHS